jgi:hypothetical protein
VQRETSSRPTVRAPGSSGPSAGAAAINHKTRFIPCTFLLVDQPDTAVLPRDQRVGANLHRRAAGSVWVLSLWPARGARAASAPRCRRMPPTRARAVCAAAGPGRRGRVLFNCLLTSCPEKQLVTSQPPSRRRPGPPRVLRSPAPPPPRATLTRLRPAPPPSWPRP